MFTKLKNQTEGFTIIEVLIVLAIAGLIMLIVFLAVPALQRNSHNTSIKNDVSSILGGVSEFTNNNNGNLPGYVKTTAGDTTKMDFAKSATVDGNMANVKVGFIDATVLGGAIVALPADGTTLAATDATGTVKLYSKAVCDSADTSKANTTGTNSRNLVAIYKLEGGAVLCQAT